MKKPRKYIHMRIDPEKQAKLVLLAKQRGMTVSEMVRRAVKAMFSIEI